MTASRPQPHLPLPSSSFRGGGGGKILTIAIGGIVLAVAIAFATGFASGNAAKQAELVQMKAEASTSGPSALYTPKSSKVPKAKSSKAPLGWECEMMVGMHFSDGGYHGITCVINTVTTCVGYSPPTPNACCYGVTMDWDVTTGIELAAMFLPDVTGQSSVLAVQGSSGNGTIAGAITFAEGMIKSKSGRMSETETASTYTNNLYQVFAYGALDVEIMK